MRTAFAPKTPTQMWLSRQRDTRAAAPKGPPADPASRPQLHSDGAAHELR